MSKYTDIIAMANTLCEGKIPEADYVMIKVSKFTGDDFVDVLEISREILHDNSNDDALISNMNRFLELVSIQYTKRLMNKS